MTASSIEAELNTLEARLNAVSAALISGEAPDLEAHSREMHRAMVVFAQGTIGMALPPVTVARLVKISQTLAHQRENLLRRAVVVDRALASFLPPTDTPTYARSVGKSPAANAARLYAARAT